MAIKERIITSGAFVGKLPKVFGVIRVSKYPQFDEVLKNISAIWDRLPQDYVEFEPSESYNKLYDSITYHRSIGATNVSKIEGVDNIETLFKNMNLAELVHLIEVVLEGIIHIKPPQEKYGFRTMNTKDYISKAVKRHTNHLEVLCSALEVSLARYESENKESNLEGR